MKDNFEKYLILKYPNLFQTRKTQNPSSFAFWGFECGDGWVAILDKLSHQITEHVENKQATHPGFSVIASQVKEKFGTLRFYTYGYDDVIVKLVQEADDESSITCENCGKPGQLREGNWIRTLCDSCSVKR